MTKGKVIIKQKKKKNDEITYKTKFIDKLGLEQKGIVKLALETNNIQIPPHWQDMSGDDVLDFIEELHIERIMFDETTTLLLDGIEILKLTFGKMKDSKSAVEIVLSYEVTKVGE